MNPLSVRERQRPAGLSLPLENLHLVPSLMEEPRKGHPCKAAAQDSPFHDLYYAPMPYMGNPFQQGGRYLYIPIYLSIIL